MNRITVFCGSSIGTDEDFEFQAKELGRKLAIKNIQLVYGVQRFFKRGKSTNGSN